MGNLLSSPVPARPRLRSLLAGPDPVLAPGAYDALSARLIEQAVADRLQQAGEDLKALLAAAPPGQAAMHDGNESVESLWIRPAQALAETDAGLRKLVFATRLNLTIEG